MPAASKAPFFTPERGRGTSRDATKTGARSHSRESVLSNMSRMTGLSEMLRRIVDSVLLRREQAKEEKRRREQKMLTRKWPPCAKGWPPSKGKRPPWKTNSKTSKTRWRSWSAQTCTTTKARAARKITALMWGMSSIMGKADSKPSDLVVRALCPTICGHGSQALHSDRSPGTSYQLAKRTTKSPWRNHAKDYPRGSHGRWTKWEELWDALYQQYHPREHQQTTMKNLANLSQAKCDGDLEKHIETFNSLHLQIPIPRDEQFWVMRFHLGLSVQEAARRDFRIIGDEKKRPIHGASAAGASSTENTSKETKLKKRREFKIPDVRTKSENVAPKTTVAPDIKPPTANVAFHANAAVWTAGKDESHNVTMEGDVSIVNSTTGTAKWTDDAV
ncbi:MAG: hypothetical protein BJ554DRAFT_3838, partial [Olpidium bornovanus]